MKEIKNQTIKDIIEANKNINVKAISIEVLKWIIENVEQFIDNQVKTFKLDINLAENLQVKELENLIALQNLYRMVPNDPLPKLEDAPDESRFDQLVATLSPEDKLLFDEIVFCLKELNETCEKVHCFMKENNELLEQLFEKMIFYYELKGIKEGKMLVDELRGAVDILKFEYDNFFVNVLVSRSENSTAYQLSEGFSVSIAIAFTPALKMASVF